MIATQTPGAGVLQAEGPVAAWPKGPSITHAHRPPSNCLHSGSRALARFDVATTPDIESAVDSKAPVFIGIIGGKDSRVLAYRLCDCLDEGAHAGRRLLIHSDLGRAGWRQSLTGCARLAARLGPALVVASRQDGDTMDRWLPGCLAAWL
jgi:hypothetical protein